MKMHKKDSKNGIFDTDRTFYAFHSFNRGENLSDNVLIMGSMNSNQIVEKTAMAMFGAGCFWGVEAQFRAIPGVLVTEVGYAGGAMKNPTYEDVCTDESGHAEVVRVTFDPSKVGYAKLLEVFWNGHNPTTLNRQGPDIGSQYRSAIFFYSPEQQAEATASRDALTAAKKYPRPIVTEISPAPDFYRAEEYHQQYLEKRGLASCHI